MSNEEQKSITPGIYLWLIAVNIYISMFAFGGGYVVVPLVRRSFVEKKKIFTEDELMEMSAVAQSSPGAIAVNLAALSGYKAAGTAGAYNHNIVKLEEEILARPGIHKLFIVGELGRHYFAKRDVQIDTNFQYTVQNPTMHRARDIAAVLLDQFRERELDEIYIVYTRMENSVQAEAEVMKLLPLERSSFNEMKMPLNVHREAIALYPSAEAVMDSIIPNYVTGIVYGALVEAYASEHNARMMAMKSATDSAKSLIHDLSIIYNRARQAAITQEITEVCSGARAQRK